jgi:uncharacterized membrane protein YtjA (UPF0391 family)
MIYWALVFLLVSIIAGFFGFRGVASLAATISKFLFTLFFTLFIILVALIVTGN